MPISMRNFQFFYRLTLVAILLGTLLAAGARADVAQNPPLTPTIDTALIRQAVADLSGPDFRVSYRSDEQTLSTDLTSVPENPSAPESIGPVSLLFPFLLIVLAGSVRRYYTSVAYKQRQLYESIYGPLNWY